VGGARLIDTAQGNNIIADTMPTLQTAVTPDGVQLISMSPAGIVDESPAVNLLGIQQLNTFHHAVEDFSNDRDTSPCQPSLLIFPGQPQTSSCGLSLPSGTNVTVLATSADQRSRLAGTADGKMLIFGPNQALMKQIILRTGSKVTAITALTGGGFVAQTSDGGLFDYNGLANNAAYMEGFLCPCDVIAVPGGNVTAILAQDVQSNLFQNPVLINANSGVVITTLNGALTPITGFAASMDGNMLATTEQSGVLRIWNMQKSGTYGLYAAYDLAEGEIEQPEFSPDGNSISVMNPAGRRETVLPLNDDQAILDKAKIFLHHGT
jgi:hypothetical protein